VSQINSLKQKDEAFSVWCDGITFMGPCIVIIF